jgi:aspartyl-tRNA(Asn)/glutamyl-tRNA(Gln) amidotransferase subunit A
MAVEGATLHRKWLQERPHDYADQVRSRLEPGLFYPATRYVEALSMRDALAQDWVDTVIGDADVAVLPVLTTSVPSIQATMSGNPNDIAAIVAGVTRNTGALNYLGLPAISIHCGFSSDGLPIGVQVVGRPWTEPLLIKIADAFQSATHWHEAVPPHLAALDDSRGTLTDAQAREIRA